MNSQRELMDMFPYQFNGEAIALDITRGWFALFSQLCRDIDEELGEDKRGFHWRQVKEKLGSLRVSFRLKDGVYELEPVLVRKIFQLTGAAEKASETICAVCGAPGRIDPLFKYLMALCDMHRDHLLVGIPVTLWLGDDKV